MNEENKDPTENLLQQPQPLNPEELMKIIGKNLTYFLNLSGVMPARAKDTLEAHQAWAGCCDFAMSLESGETVCINQGVANAIKAAETAVKKPGKPKGKKK